MHVTIIASSIILWFALLSSDGVSAFLAATSTGAQMSLLGAILTFARHPLFEVHAFTTAPWGFSQIEDQQLGGLLMWIPAGLLLTGYSIAAIGLAMRRLDAAPQREYLQRRA
jgi:putative membrane protein